MRLYHELGVAKKHFNRRSRMAFIPCLKWHPKAQLSKAAVCQEVIFPRSAKDSWRGTAESQADL
jgi:hypothetical protein